MYNHVAGSMTGNSIHFTHFHPFSSPFARVMGLDMRIDGERDRVSAWVYFVVVANANARIVQFAH
jgi:hypothetical protein